MHETLRAAACAIIESARDTRVICGLSLGKGEFV